MQIRSRGLSLRKENRLIAQIYICPENHSFCCQIFKLLHGLCLLALPLKIWAYKLWKKKNSLMLLSSKKMVKGLHRMMLLIRFVRNVILLNIQGKSFRSRNHFNWSTLTFVCQFLQPHLEVVGFSIVYHIDWKLKWLCYQDDGIRSWRRIDIQEIWSFFCKSHGMRLLSTMYSPQHLKEEPNHT